MRAGGFRGCRASREPSPPSAFRFRLPPSFIVQEACRISFHAIYTDLYEVGMVSIDESFFIPGRWIDIYYE